MKKKLIGRGLLGFPVGIAIGYVITVIISICIGDGFFYPVTPELVNKIGERTKCGSHSNRSERNNGHRICNGFGYLGDRFVESCKAKRDLLRNCLRDYVPYLLFCQLDAPFDRWNSVLCRHIRSDLPRCLGNSVFCVEKED